uniref:Putative secreted protein n=1 Tax=Ixodes ricinus TaxID=34613 RepID=A0A6B0U696_IXORI
MAVAAAAAAVLRGSAPTRTRSPKRAAPRGTRLARGVIRPARTAGKRRRRTRMGPTTVATRATTPRRWKTWTRKRTVNRA